MTKEKLIKLLKAHEWNDVEFKEARREVPKSAYETVSAFANANGGWIVFGVTLVKDDYQPVGVELVDKVQNDFLSAHNQQWTFLSRLGREALPDQGSFPAWQ